MATIRSHQSSNDNTIFLLDYIHYIVYVVGCRWFFDHYLLYLIFSLFCLVGHFQAIQFLYSLRRRIWVKILHKLPTELLIKSMQMRVEVQLLLMKQLCFFLHRFYEQLCYSLPTESFIYIDICEPGINIRT